jgi:hypothetical protein
MTLTEKHERAVALYHSYMHHYTTLQRGLETKESKKDMEIVEDNLHEVVDNIGHLLECGQFPYGREVSRILYPVPNYRPSLEVAQLAIQGLSIAQRTGQLTYSLTEPTCKAGDKE